MNFSQSTRRGLVVAAAFALMVPASAMAQEASASHIAAARDAIAAIDATAQFDNILPNAATQIKAELIPNSPDRQTEISDMVDERAIELAPRRAALESEVARVYANLFTEEELRAIADFYQSEAGKKLLAQGPAATRDMLQAAEVWSNGIERDLRQSALDGMNELYGSATPAEGAAPADPAAPATPQ
ncbi:MAG: DUF2059 domain-containing protein [Aurantimonas endophytica]|uniref:DUF2059 domain-containing protein n=1 Tax=Aurantimonas endophytica TaxID=1522175 RepID=A0A7W6MNH1_9HYPH|nr:DUF2059 domain-containing protein [Aurantimonas endophytica]MBB4001847.1 hypothetical protein [Aurantimonas endophytica]MCO6402516.1 DUF2059 domain-containing protein [Aurantimonas endophytica]